MRRIAWFFSAKYISLCFRYQNDYGKVHLPTRELDEFHVGWKENQPVIGGSSSFARAVVGQNDLARLWLSRRGHAKKHHVRCTKIVRNRGWKAEYGASPFVNCPPFGVWGSRACQLCPKYWRHCGYDAWCDAKLWKTANGGTSVRLARCTFSYRS